MYHINHARLRAVRLVNIMSWPCLLVQKFKQHHMRPHRPGIKHLRHSLACINPLSTDTWKYIYFCIRSHMFSVRFDNLNAARCSCYYYTTHLNHQNYRNLSPIIKIFQTIFVVVTVVYVLFEGKTKKHAEENFKLNPWHQRFVHYSFAFDLQTDSGLYP